MTPEKFVKRCKAAESNWSGEDLAALIMFGVLFGAFFIGAIIAATFEGSLPLRVLGVVASAAIVVGWIYAVIATTWAVVSVRFIERLKERPDLREIYLHECAPDIKQKEEEERRRKLVTW